jgi:hypothetical protein
VKVSVGKFASSGIENELGSTVGAGVLAALVHYSDRLDSGAPPLAPPRFLDDRATEDVISKLEVTVDPQLRAKLEREARRHQVALERLVTHAVLVYLADLDGAADGGDQAD